MGDDSEIIRIHWLSKKKIFLLKSINAFQESFWHKVLLDEIYVYTWFYAVEFIQSINTCIITYHFEVSIVLVVKVVVTRVENSM